jgi:predicted glycosyltransferase
MLPEVISENAVKHDRAHILKYPGIKEDVYVPDFHPDLQIRSALKIGPEEILVTIRPPATQAHYHNPEAEVLLSSIVNYLGKLENTRMVILPRDEEQAEFLKNTWPGLYASEKVIIPEQVVDGLNLLWNSDLAISGGGTMNREAAALGVPVYSIFRGKTGDVDRYLVKTNRLVMLENSEDIPDKLSIVKRPIPQEMGELNHVTLNAVVENILKALRQGESS